MSRPPRTGEGGSRIHGGGVDVLFGHQLASKRRFLRAACDRHGAKTHFTRELDTQVPQPSEAGDGKR